MYNLFSFAIGVRLVAFIIFVACVYGGNLLFAKLEQRQSKFLWKIRFMTRKFHPIYQDEVVFTFF